MAYQELTECVKNSTMPPIQESWLQNIMNKIPDKLQKGKEQELAYVLTEVEQNFFNSMRKSLLQQSLKDPEIPGLVTENLTPPVLEPTYAVFLLYNNILVA